MRKNHILLALGLVILALSITAQEWELPLSIYRHPDSTQALIAKTSVYGSDMYDSTVIVGPDSFEVDVPHPPCPPSGLCTYFILEDPAYPYIDKLSIDGRSYTADTIVWTLWWSGASPTDSIYLTWDPGDVPTHGTFLVASTFVGTDPDWGTATDMSTGSSVAAMAGAYWFKMRYTFTVPDVDSMPPYFTNWQPPDGAVDVPETTSMFCVDIMDAMSPIDESSITLNVAGIDVPSMFFDITPITDGVRLCVSTGGMITLPPCSTIYSIVCAADTGGNSACDTSSFTTGGCGTPTHCVAGTVSLAGVTDWSNTFVLVEAFHDTTDSAGYFEICDVPEGTLMVRVYHDCYYPDSLELILSSDTTLNFALLPSCGSISGTVTLDGMTDHSGVIVTETGSAICDTTDTAGDYMLESVPFGTVEVVASYSGFAPDTASFSFTGDTTDIDFYLFPLTTFWTVDGAITLQGETDHSGTEIILSGLTYNDTVTTGTSGAFSFADIPDGSSLNFSATHTGFEAFDTTLDVTSDITLNRELDTIIAPGYNPPSNVQATNRPCYPDFIYVSWDVPMQGDTVLLSHTGGNMSCGYWDPYVWYSPYGWANGGFAMPFVGPSAGAQLTKIRFDIATIMGGITTNFHVWAEDPDSGGPGADLVTPISVTFPSAVNFEWYEIEIDPPVTVGTDVFFVGWIDETDYPNCIFVRQDYTTPDSLTWIHYATDDVWAWRAEYVDECDIDYAIECFVVDGARARPEPIEPMAERLQQTKVLKHRDPDTVPTARLPREAIHAPEGYRPSRGLMRPMEDATAYRLYKSTTPFSDTTAATFVAEFDDTVFGYVDTAITPGTTYYYGMVAVYPGGVSSLSNVSAGFTDDSPDPTDVLIIDWAGGWNIEDSLGWAWDPTDTLVELLAGHGISGDSVAITGEHERLYVIELTDDDTTLYNLVIIEWNPLSNSGWLGPRPRVAEWHKIYDFLMKGGNLFIEGPDAMEILSSDGATPANNPYDSLFSLLGVTYYDQGVASLDTGNVMTLEGSGPLFSPGFDVDYMFGHISDFDVDEFEHAGGAFTVLNSQISSPPPPPHLSTGRGVWNPATAPAVYKTYVTSTYLASIIDIPSGTASGILLDVIKGFWPEFGIDEKAISLPGEMTLFGNFPNPFNAATEILFELSKPAEADLSVYDMMGHKVTTLGSGPLKDGYHKVVWDGTDTEGYPVESGIYFYKLTTDAGSVTRRMVLLK